MFAGLPLPVQVGGVRLSRGLSRGYRSPRRRLWADERRQGLLEESAACERMSDPEEASARRGWLMSRDRGLCREQGLFTTTKSRRPNSDSQLDL